MERSMGPRWTRNRLILELEAAIPLVDEWETLRYVKKVSSGRRRPIADSPRCSLELQFWMSENEVFAVKVAMPYAWTPKVYLALLFVSLSTHTGISVKQQWTEDRENGMSLNNVHTFLDVILLNYEISSTVTAHYLK
jgi:hypothetical protein